MSVVVPSRPRRNTETVLILLALVITTGASLIASIGMEQTIGTDFWVQNAVLAVMAIAFHVVLRIKAPYADPYLLPVAVTLNGIGVAMIHRLDLVRETNVGNMQILWTALAMLLSMLMVWFLRDHRVLSHWTYIFLVASAILLLLPLIPGLGIERNGARIWINLGFGTFQPGEAAKLTLATFFAGYLSANRNLILLAGKKLGPVTFPRFRDLAPLVIAWVLSMGVLVFQTDLGSALLFFGLFIAMLYLATARISWVILGFSAAAIGGIIAATTFSHVQARLNGWLNAFDPEMIEAQGGSHQVVQGLFGLANGGLIGTGLGAGRPDLVPLANSDMIVSALGEELGLVGLAGIIMLFVLLITRMIRSAMGVRDAFGKVLAGGLAVILTLQCFIVMGGVFRVIPLTGLTTPFMSAGGSSLVVNWLIVTLVIIISQAARQPVDIGPMVNASGSGSGAEDRTRPVNAGGENS